MNFAQYSVDLLLTHLASLAYGPDDRSRRTAIPLTVLRCEAKTPQGVSFGNRTSAVLDV